MNNPLEVLDAIRKARDAGNTLEVKRLEKLYNKMMGR